jgi:hypothetical protein
MGLSSSVYRLLLRHHGPALLISAAIIQASWRKAATASVSASLSARQARSSSARASALNPAGQPTCAAGRAAKASRCMKISSRYSPHEVCSPSAPSVSGSYERVKDSRSAQGWGVAVAAAAAAEGRASEELEEAVVPDWFEGSSVPCRCTTQCFTERRAKA